MLFASEAAVDDLHLDGIGLRAAYKLSAAKAHVVIDGYLCILSIAVRRRCDSDGNKHDVVPVGIRSFPCFLCHARCLHACLLFLLAIGDEAAEVVEAVAIVGREEGCGE